MVAAADPRQVKDAVDLAQLRRFEVAGVLAAVEPGGRIRHGRIQEGFEQLVAQVVVAVDVLPRARRGVVLGCRLPGLPEPAEFLQGAGDQHGHPAGEDGEHRGQLVGRRVGRAGRRGGSGAPAGMP